MFINDLKIFVFLLIKSIIKITRDLSIFSNELSNFTKAKASRSTLGKEAEENQSWDLYTQNIQHICLKLLQHCKKYNLGKKEPMSDTEAWNKVTFAVPFCSDIPLNCARQPPKFYHLIEWGLTSEKFKLLKVSLKNLPKLHYQH